MQKLVIVGAGMATGRMLEHLFEADPEAYEVTVFNAEPRGNDNRLMLSPILSGEKSYAEIVTHDDAWYAGHKVTCRFGEQVVRIDRERKVVVGETGEVPYDRLVIGTGSAPFIIPVPGKDLSGVVTYRDLDDTNAMIAAAGTPGARAVVIGGGLLGLEAAAGLRLRGMEVTLVDLAGISWTPARRIRRHLLRRDPRGARHHRPDPRFDQGDPRPRHGRRGAPRGRHHARRRSGGHGSRYPPGDAPRHRRRAGGRSRDRGRCPPTDIGPVDPCPGRMRGTGGDAVRSRGAALRPGEGAGEHASRPARRLRRARPIHEAEGHRLRSLLRRRLRRGRGARGHRLPRSRPWYLQAPRPRGRPPDRRRDVRRHGGRELVFRPHPGPGRHLRDARHADLRPGPSG